MGPRKEEVAHRVAPLGIKGPGIPEEALMAVGQSRMNGLCETNMRIEEVVPQIRITRTREHLRPGTPKGGMFQSLKQEMRKIERDIHGMQQRSKL